MPVWMFRTSARLKRASLNGAGYYAAHILNARPARSLAPWTRRAILEVRTLRNVHPCNLFLVPRPDRWTGRRLGEAPDIVAHAARVAEHRYAAVWRATSSVPPTDTRCRPSTRVSGFGIPD